MTRYIKPKRDTAYYILKEKTKNQDHQQILNIWTEALNIWWPELMKKILKVFWTKSDYPWSWK